MRRPRIYIDTSVVGGCFDAEFMEASRALFQMAEQGDITILVSDLLTDELVEAPAEVGTLLQGLARSSVELITRSDEAHELQRQYLLAGILGASSSDDALHVALATVAEANVIVSWNFKHIVHLDRIKKFNAVNALQGYPSIEIRSPWEVV